jgi:hypothetical protein
MADNMPILSKLMGARGTSAKPNENDSPQGITFDDLSDEQFDALQAEAIQASQGGDDEQAEAEGQLDPNEANEPEQTEEEQQAEAAQQVATLAEACHQEVQGYREQIEKLVDTAGTTDDGDPKKVKKLLKEAEGLEKDSEKALEKVKAAADDGDPEGAQKSYEDCESACQDALDLLKEAQDAAGVDAGADPAAAPKVAPAAKPGAPAAAPAAPAAKKPALAVWAGR